jgi:hypothetical protein
VGKRKADLVGVVKGSSRRVVVGVRVIDLESGEHGVVESDVYADDGEDDGVLLVGLERGRDREVGGGVSVEDVDELRLFDRPDHDGPPLWIGREVLAGHDPTGSRLAVRLLMELFERRRRRNVLEDHDPARVRADDDVVYVVRGTSQQASSDESEGRRRRREATREEGQVRTNPCSHPSA